MHLHSSYVQKIEVKNRSNPGYVLLVDPEADPDPDKKVVNPEHCLAYFCE